MKKDKRKRKMLYNSIFFSIRSRYNISTNYFTTSLHLKKNHNAYNWNHYQKNKNTAKQYASEHRKTLQARIIHKEWLSNNKEKTSCHNKINKLVKKYNLTRESCAICDNILTEFHHFDYSLPYCGIWLCKKCHTKIHRGEKYAVHCESTT